MGNLNGEIYVLQQRASRLTRGDELCDHHWNNTDGCFETYCTGCDKHIGEERSENDIPFKDDAYCFECQKTPEEKEIERLEIIKYEKEEDIKNLTELIGKYPAEAKEILGSL
jgi:hypothetical protein